MHNHVNKNEIVTFVLYYILCTQFYGIHFLVRLYVPFWGHAIGTIIG